MSILLIAAGTVAAVVVLAALAFKRGLASGDEFHLPLVAEPSSPLDSSPLQLVSSRCS
jgi:hypothetical protein